MSYKHLSPEERYYIEVERGNEVSSNEIAKHLSRATSTISREIARNSGERGYRHKQALKRCQERHTNKAKRVKITQKVGLQITSFLKQDWSPEQIAGRLAASDTIKLHHESIYRYILSDKQAGGQLYKHLRHQRKKYRKRYGSAHNRTGIPNRVDIDQRPQIANERKRIGDWEADTIIGKAHQGAIVTLDERKSKLRLAMPLQSKKSGPVAVCMIVLLHRLKQHVETITFDNGKEFSMHEQVANDLECTTYFAKPYHSWERGQNENANGLLRQYFPKDMKLNDVSIEDVFKAVHKLNSRPRKCLGYKTPYEAFEQHTGVDVRRVFGCALMS